MIDYTQSPTLALVQINALGGTAQLRAAADILDAIGNMTIPKHYVVSYAELASNILRSVHVRLIAASQERCRPLEERVQCL